MSTEPEIGTREWWRHGTYGLRQPIDAILRLLEQGEITRSKARELLAHTTLLQPYEWHDRHDPPPAPWDRLNWCDDEREEAQAQRDEARTAYADTQLRLDLAEEERDRYKAILEEQTECTCGCPLVEHETYGEDGIACDDEGHECLPTYPAIAEMLRQAKRERDEARAERDAIRALTPPEEVDGE